MKDFLIAFFIEYKWYLIALFIIMIYIIIGYFMATRFKPRLEKHNMSFFGPFLLWKTTRGRKLIDRLARFKLFWKLYATVGIVILFIMMISMFFILILGAYSVWKYTPDPMPLENILVLPGLNPLIPLWYGLVALIIAVVIHEFAHGILARVADIKLKSMGVVFFVIPVGAFVEPDENKLRTTGKLKRDRVFAAGPATNIFVGIICALIFAWGFMGALEPTEDGVLVLEVSEDYPAEAGGMKPGMVIVSIEGTASDGTVLPSTEINNTTDFENFLKTAHTNDILNITIYESGKNIILQNITLVDKGEYYNGTPLYKSEFDGQGFLGMNSMGVTEFSERLAHPIKSAEGDRGELAGNLIYFTIRLPLDTGTLPFHEPLTDIYEVNGALGALPNSMFWILANAFYYLFWINILLGIFNALPAVPLDGGYPYRDAWDSVLKRLRPKQKDEERELAVGQITLMTSFSILFLLLFTIIFPNIR
jgi:membrane-associated protease RseP (regulator of RpoE activity)